MSYFFFAFTSSFFSIYNCVPIVKLLGQQNKITEIDENKRKQNEQEERKMILSLAFAFHFIWQIRSKHNNMKKSLRILHIHTHKSTFTQAHIHIHTLVHPHILIYYAVTHIHTYLEMFHFEYISFSGQKCEYHKKIAIVWFVLNVCFFLFWLCQCWHWVSAVD